MAEDEVAPEVIDDLHKRAEEQESELPEAVDVPLRGSEDEAMRAVQQQFKDAGTECTDDEARKLVHAAWKKYGKKDEKYGRRIGHELRREVGHELRRRMGQELGREVGHELRREVGQELVEKWTVRIVSPCDSAGS